MAANRQISYIKPSEPSFLAKFKKDVGYKEGPTVDTKKEGPSLDDLPDRPDDDDEKPVVVVLKKGDLTQEEADHALGEVDTRSTPQTQQEEEEEDIDAGDGRVVFRKPTKRSQAGASDLNVSSSKKKREKEKKQKSSTSKKVQNSSLLSFGDDEEEDGDT